MHDYRFNHISNYKNAIGAPVKIVKGEHEGKTGIITNVFNTMFKDMHGHAFEITLDDDSQGRIELYSGDRFDSLFKINIALEDGKKYLTMKCDIVTMHKDKYDDGFHVNYSEICKDKNNNCTESYWANGFAYHYDCGMNILKEWNEDTIIYGVFE